MGWKARFRRSKSSAKDLKEALQKLDEHALKSQQHRLSSTGFKRKIFSSQKSPKEAEEHSRKGRVHFRSLLQDVSAKLQEAAIDSGTIDTLIAVIRDTLDEEDDEHDRRWSKRLQWPSQKYLRSSFVRVQEQLQSTSCLYHDGEAKVLSANAGDIACLGPCLLQSKQPIHTLIVHGEMEYCTLLGHLLHIDLAVYFAALRTFAHFLEGRTQLRELVFAFTTCPEHMTDKHQRPVSENFAQEVLPAFEQALETSGCLRHVSFRITHEQTQRVNLSRLCSTSYEAICQQRTAVLCATHPRCIDASPLIRRLPNDILRHILDLAFPLPGPSGVDLEFSHRTSPENKSQFVLWRLGRRETSL